MNYYQGKNEWFDTHWADKITPEFAEWWDDFCDFHLTQDEKYFERMAFAFMGWEARRILYEEQENG